MTNSRPKDAGARRNKTPQVHDWVDVPDEPFDGPSLEETRGGVAWCQAASDWWEAVRTLPHAVLWNGSDWIFAVQTAQIVNEINTGNFSSTLLSQLTRRELAIGMTEAQRRAQRLRYVTPAAAAAAKKSPPAASASGRRDRVLKVVDEAS